MKSEIKANVVTNSDSSTKQVLIVDDLGVITFQLEKSICWGVAFLSKREYEKIPSIIMCRD